MTTWLEDASANRHIKTYVKDFLDLSGNFTVRTNYEDYKWNSYGQLMSGVYESDGAVYFGKRIDMDATGTTIGVTAHRENTDGALGVARVYKYDSDAEVWYQLGNNLLPDTSIDDAFGYDGICLSHDGTIVAVNDATSKNSSNNSNIGKTYVFQYNADTNNWDTYGDNQTELEGYSSNEYLGNLGISMSKDGSTIALTEQLSVVDIRIKKLVNGSWTNIWDTSVLSGNDSRPSLNYDGSRVVFNNYTNQLAYVYEYSGSGTTWNQVGSAIPNTGGSGHSSSTSINNAGDIVAVNEQVGDTVSVYQFVDTDWVKLGSTLTHPDGAGSEFGVKTKLNAAGDMIIIGASVADTIHIFKYQNGDWVQIGDTLTGIGSSQTFGATVAISDDGTKILGSGANDDLNGTNSGYVQAFQWSREPMDHPIMEVSGNTFTIDCNSKNHASSYTVAELGNTLYGDSAGDHFGMSAEMNKDGTVVVIGAPGDEKTTNADNGGSVSVYLYRSGIWQQKGSKFTPYGSITAYDSQFGIGVDINDDGNIIVVGSGQDYNAAGTLTGNTGSLDAFEFTNGDWVQKGSSIKGIVSNDNLGYHSCSINGAGNIIAGLFHTSGFVRVYQYDDDTSDWVQMGGDIPMTPGITTVGEYNQTRRIDLSEDGTIIALGDVEDDTAGTNDGKITIYKYTVVDNVGSWNKLGNDIVGPTTSSFPQSDVFGVGVSLSSDGHTVAFTSLYWNSEKGLARIFKYSEEGNVWTQLGADLNSENVGGATYAFRGMGLSGDGKTFIHGDGHNDGGVSNGGAVHMYKYLNGQWNHFHTEYGTISNGYFGMTGVGMSRDGTRFVAGSGYASSDQGYSRMFEITHTPVLKIANGEVTFGSFSGHSLSYGDLKSTFNDDAFTTTGNVGIGTSSSETVPLNIWGYNPSHNTTIYPFNMTSMTQSSSGIQAGLGVGIQFASERRHTDDIYSHGYLYSYAATTNNQWNLGLQCRNNDTFTEHMTLRYDGNVGFGDTTPSYTLETPSTAVATSGWTTASDDRLKVNEQKIEGALTTLQKLVPQTYTKYEKFDISGNKTITDLSSDSIFEAGLIAQEIYYNAPELRNLISIGSDASSNNFHPQEYDLSGNDIQQDPDYTALGWTEKSAGVNYMELVPYLIKAIQEQQEMIVEQESQIQSLVVDLAALKNK